MGDAPAAHLICDTYGLGSPAGELTPAAEGEQGVIWRLDTDRGAFAVKGLVMRQVEAEQATSSALQDAAAALDTLVIPASIRTPAGLLLAELGGWQVRVQEWADLADADPSIDPARMGALLADLHAVGQPTSDPVHPWYTDPVGDSAWRDFGSALAARDDPLSARVRDGLAEVEALEATFCRPTQLRVCHCDLWADNVRLTPSGAVCVIDWDNAGPADVSHELAMVLWEYGLDDEERTRALYAAYCERGGPGRLATAGHFTMVAAQFGHFYESALQAWLDPASSQEDLDWARGRFEELLDRPLTRASVAQTLGWVA